MKRWLLIWAGGLFSVTGIGLETVVSDEVIDELLVTTCVDCHDSDTDTGFDITRLPFEMTEDNQFRKWIKVFDRLSRGEMPPKDAVQPPLELKAQALARMEQRLTKINREKQQVAGRVPSRRLTRDEYEHVLHDLLGIGGQIARYLPPENEAASFDVVADKQEMSSVHVAAPLSLQ